MQQGTKNAIGKAISSALPPFTISAPLMALHDDGHGRRAVRDYAFYLEGTELKAGVHPAYKHKVNIF